MTLVSGAAGVIEGVWWSLTGVADTLTGGAFTLAPEPATQLSLRPQVSPVIADAAPPPRAEDRCGRPLTESAGAAAPAPSGQTAP